MQTSKSSTSKVEQVDPHDGTLHVATKLILQTWKHFSNIFPNAKSWTGGKTICIIITFSLNHLYNHLCGKNGRKKRINGGWKERTKMLAVIIISGWWNLGGF